MPPVVRPDADTIAAISAPERPRPGRSGQFLSKSVKVGQSRSKSVEVRRSSSKSGEFRRIPSKNLQRKSNAARSEFGGCRGLQVPQGCLGCNHVQGRNMVGACAPAHGTHPLVKRRSRIRFSRNVGRVRESPSTLTPRAASCARSIDCSQPAEAPRSLPG